MSRRRVNAALIVAGAVVVGVLFAGDEPPEGSSGCCLFECGCCHQHAPCGPGVCCGCVTSDCPVRFVFVDNLQGCTVEQCEVGACCLPDGACTTTSRGWCELGAGGVFLGLDVPCDGPFCSSGCCLPGLTCENLGQTECLSLGGLWQNDGSDCAAANCPCPPDINGSGEVNVIDLIRLLLCFGLPASPECEAEDINGDATVNVLDLIDLLLAFGQSCP